MNRTGNPALDRATKIANASAEQRERARRDYADYERRLRAIHQVAESFEFYFGEWIDVQKVKLDAGEEPDRHEPRRDYSPNYKSGEK
jgi:hypothetical protein